MKLLATILTISIASAAAADVYKCDTDPVTYQDVPCDQPLEYNPPALTVAPTTRDAVTQLRIMREIRGPETSADRAQSSMQLTWGERQTLKNTRRALRSEGGYDYHDYLKREASAIWGQPYLPGVVIDDRR